MPNAAADFGTPAGKPSDGLEGCNRRAHVALYSQVLRYIARNALRSCAELLVQCVNLKACQ